MSFQKNLLKKVKIAYTATFKILNVSVKLSLLIPKNTSNKEIDNMIEEYKAFMDNAINASSDGFVTESGEVEKWVGGVNKERAQEL